MRRTPCLLVMMLTVLAATACSQKVVQVYLGARLPADEVALLHADLSASQDLAALSIRRVNGVDTLRARPPAIETLPGPQILRVELLRRASGDEVVSDARSFKTITFDAVAGRVYYIRGKMMDGVGHVWVVDDTQTMINSAEPVVAQ